MNYIIEFQDITHRYIDPDLECIVSYDDLQKYIKEWDAVNDARLNDYTATNAYVNARMEGENILWTCQECEGSGSVTGYEECGKPASECCGGCTEEHSCPTCNGVGEILFDKLEL